MWNLAIAKKSTKILCACARYDRGVKGGFAGNQIEVLEGAGGMKTSTAVQEQEESRTMLSR